MHDPHTLIYGCWLFDLWHVDPEKKGNDDSCGWFMRASHGDQKVLQKIEREFAFDWDRVYTTNKEDHDEDDGPFESKTYFRGYFAPNGEPVMSVHSIVLNLFFIAAGIHFGDRWNKGRKFCQKHLFEILLFAENPTDSMSDGIRQVFGGDSNREERIAGVARTIYGWILRKDLAWWKHPKWHVHHWKLNIKPWLSFNRWAFSRCYKCGKGFKWGESPTTNNWYSRGPRFLIGESDVFHSKCHGAESKRTP